MTQSLKDILYGVHIISVNGDTSVEVDELVFDSRKSRLGNVFFAIKGVAVDGHDFIPQAIENGCKVIISEKELELNDVDLVVVDNTASALAIAASNFYGEPSKQLKLIGVTGTNGKTTITTLLHKLYSELGYQCGLISTVVNKICHEEIPSTHTTPDPIMLNQLLSRMVEEGVSHCFMEVSSHAIHQHRIDGLKFTGGVFTNITRDHLDYHKTFKEYIEVKKKFFDMLPKAAFALTNVDDKNGMVMLQNTAAKQKTYALKNIADYKAKVLENQFTGLVINIEGTELWSKLIGDFKEVLTVLSQLESVDGRFQYVRSDGGVTAIIDYAHTPDALENVLKTIDNIRTKNETVYTVVGCGGDRDKGKRPMMAEIACNHSDKVILTSDNPRSEDPNTIIDDMMEGVDGANFKKTLSIVDRAQAIKTAASMAEKDDIILIAGKGHEKYQEIKGVKHDFDDKATIIELFKKLNK
jgi:UDP-N-acetylmuramoyl-L-alanyl-D-glutamate--2,6-diaminopimelate ligase